MTLKTRRIIMFVFIGAFFIIAPILVFYASGYRFDFKRERVIKTGTLMLQANDVKANLYINNELYETQFNDKIFVYNLLPGDYDIRLEKNGYYSWEKKLSVYSNTTTFAQNIILFKKEVPLQVVDGKIINFSITPDFQKLVYLLEVNSSWNLYDYNIGTRENALLAALTPGKSSELSFAASNKKILLKVGSQYFVYDIENQKSGSDLKSIISFAPQNLKWDLQSDNLLYAEYKNSIYSVNIFDKKVEKIFENKENINSEFYLEGNDVFYIQQEKDRNTLYKYNLISKTTKRVLDLAESKNYLFTKSNGSYIGLIDRDHAKFYLIKKTNEGQEISINSGEPIKEFNAKGALWDRDGKQVLLYNDFEIYIYNPSTGEENIINRYGEVVQKALWYPNLYYIVIQFDDSVQIIDLTLTNGTHAVTEILGADKISNFYLDENGNTIFFDGSLGKQEGLYKLKIR
ncbi:MAG: hypothetical protein PHC97_02480 [Patescibacteria group bacterium]|nr:hypothetical protein [Patescibacteria group bacterium]